jgi:uncharacterized repeat protein (TIGR03803 family)
MRKVQIVGSLAFLMLVASAAPAQAQTFTQLYLFGTNPGDPIDGGTTPNVVAQGRDGNLYTTSYSGGANTLGTVYKVTPSGTLTVLYSFDSTHGANPWSGVILGADGNFYGTTAAGGTLGNGTVFKMTPTGTLTVLYNFTGASDGGTPLAPPIQGTDGNLYGTAQYGGTGYGIIYKITLSGTFSTLHEFNGTDGSTPKANLVQASNGTFYGTTSTGGNNSCSCGTVFSITSSGTLTVLYNFDNTHGNDPSYASLIQGSNGNFYGTTEFGGASGDGVIYEITPAGTVTVLHSFSGSDGTIPLVALTQATDGNLYTSVINGGTGGAGTLVRISPSGANFSVQYNYTGDDGSPASPLVQNTNGIFYGKTEHGEPIGDGLFYSFSEGSAAFATFLPGQSAGKEGARIGILGQGFTSSSVVKFGGVQATTVALSGATFLTATVPAGALTGSITVTTGATTLTTPLKFKVKPTIISFSPPSGPVGTPVTVTGTGLTQATKVTFNGTSAGFTVNSDTQITATVPTGATTGKIAVTTKGGTASSTTSFTVN